ncbi:MAG: GNAT family N-acetyltransferase [Pseudomonadales bacterium]|nr:GNAT family N-acetyltransferase [Pseudomonadales bacterium]
MNSDAPTQAGTEHNIALASDAQVAQLSDILGNAFTHDPVFRWFADNPAIYSSLFRAEAEALYKHHGHMYISSDNNAAAMWLPPGVSAIEPWHWRALLFFGQVFMRGGIRSCRRGLYIERLCAAHHMREPHFYLHAIGTTLASQGRGLGSALLKQGLLACDAKHMPAYLESSNEKNNPLYERHGFEVETELKLPEGGPSIWTMKRAAR